MQIKSVTPLFFSSVNFKGVAPRHTNAEGYRIIPITKDPEMKDIKGAMDVTKKGDKPFSGLNGDAYMWGQDLVVKKYKSKNEAINYDPQREIGILDRLYDDKIALKGSQEGVYAFITPDDETYLVSTRVKGNTPSGEANNLNPKNLGAIVDALATLDIGIMDTTNGFEIKRLMHYDLSPENIKVTNDGAGLLDFEYMSYQNLDYIITEDEHQRLLEAYQDLHFSDIGLMQANLRTFEHRAFYDYIQKTDDPKGFFKNYLSEKANYYQKLRNFHIDCMQNENNHHKDRYSALARKEGVHSELLHRASLSSEYKDVKKAEAIKIQISKFLFDTGASSSSWGKANPKQVIEYIDNAKRYFKDMEEKSIDMHDHNRRCYYQDCATLVECWSKAKGNLEQYAGKIERGEQVPEKYLGDYVTTLDELVC